ncbi:MAG: hypothetical protein V3U84_08060 [Thiotrichaceae bacterium]
MLKRLLSASQAQVTGPVFQTDAGMAEDLSRGITFVMFVPAILTRQSSTQLSYQPNFE